MLPVNYDLFASECAASVADTRNLWPGSTGWHWSMTGPSAETHTTTAAATAAEAAAASQVGGGVVWAGPNEFLCLRLRAGS